MKLSKIEKQLIREIKDSTPDIYSNIKTIAESKINNEYSKTRKSSIFNFLNSFKLRVGLASAFVVFIAMLSVSLLSTGVQTNNEVFATIAIDINPSIEIKINSDEKVLSIYGANEEAQNIIDLLIFDNDNLNYTLDIIVDYLSDNSVLGEERNSILLSVNSTSIQAEDLLKASLYDRINNRFENKGFNISMITQSYNKTDESILSIADEYGISVARANIIKNIKDVDDRLSIENIANLAINDINLLINSKSLFLERIQSYGGACSEAYLREEDILDIVFNELDIINGDFINSEISFTAQEVGLVYQVELEIDDKVHRFRINAKSAEIINHNQFNPDIFSNDPPIYAISKVKALNESLDAANLRYNQVDNVEIRFVFDSPGHIYKIEFSCYNFNHYFEINAINSRVIAYRKLDRISDSSKDGSN